MVGFWRDFCREVQINAQKQVQGVRLRAHGEAQQADDSGQLAAQNIEPQTGADYFGHEVPSRRDPFKRSSY